MASFSKKLCQAVEKRRILYDRALQQRSRKIDIDNAWDAVAEECNENVQSVKTRWRNIRKVLLRCVSKTSSAQTRKTRSRDYYLYDELQFLLPHLNFSADDLADSDTEPETNLSMNTTTSKASTPSLLLEQTDESNDGAASNHAAEHVASEKRKRESKTGSVTPTRATNAVKIALPNTSHDKAVANKSVNESPSSDSTSTLRVRRHNNTTITRITPKDKVQERVVQVEEEAKDPLLLKPDGRGKRTLTRVLRERSKSMYLERPIYEANYDSDADYNPPPPKKVATPKETATSATSSIVTRKKAANKIKLTQPATAVAVRAPVEVPVAKKVVKEPEAPPSDQSTISAGNDTDNEDLIGVDITLLAAAAEAEAAAAAADADEAAAAAAAEAGITAAADVESASAAVANDKVGITAVSAATGADASVQCDFDIDEEDDEFIQRMRKWLQTMTLRQKIIFRRGIYQAYMDVHDDPREFSPKSTEKMTMSQDMPAIFTGMTPIELRLVRHLAMAVTGHKITSTAPFANFESKSHLTSLRSVGGLPVTSIVSSHNSTNDGNTKQTLPVNASLTGIRTPPEKGVGNSSAGSGGIGSSNNSNSIVRTTAIALTNHNIRAGATLPRILRKVVRVGGNSNSNMNAGAGNGANVTSNNAASASNAVPSPNILAQRNPGLLRTRLLTNNINGVPTTNSEKQRVYRILANGVVARQSPAPAGSASPNNTHANANSPTSSVGNLSLLNNPSHTLPTLPNKNNAHYRQILPKLPTLSSASGTTNTLNTVSAAPNITVNGEPKLAGISIRRHVATGQDSRMQISRRYSVCGSATASNDMQSPTRKPEDARRTVAGIQAVPMVSIADPLRGVTRVRYAQATSMRSGTTQPKFIVPSSIANQTAQMNKNIMTGPLAGVPLNEPIPVAMSTWHTTETGPNAQLQSLEPANAEKDHSNTKANDEQANMVDANDVIVAGKQNCLITSDVFENFIIKNEPLDLEDED